jgi:hypothetical protein
MPLRNALICAERSKACEVSLCPTSRIRAHCSRWMSATLCKALAGVLFDPGAAHLDIAF